MPRAQGCAGTSGPVVTFLAESHQSRSAPKAADPFLRFSPASALRPTRRARKCSPARYAHSSCHNIFAPRTRTRDSRPLPRPAGAGAPALRGLCSPHPPAAATGAGTKERGKGRARAAQRRGKGRARGARAPGGPGRRSPARARPPEKGAQPPPRSRGRRPRSRQRRVRAGDLRAIRVAFLLVTFLWRSKEKSPAVGQPPTSSG